LEKKDRKTFDQMYDYFKLHSARALLNYKGLEAQCSGSFIEKEAAASNTGSKAFPNTNLILESNPGLYGLRPEVPINFLDSVVFAAHDTNRQTSNMIFIGYR
jgi:hypothetical protein